MSDINHVAIIMDGNGRWGLKKFKSRKFGHQKGIKTVEKIIEASIKKNIKFLTMMKKNDEIAKIIDYQGKELCILKAPEDGMFFGLRALPNVTIGDWCCFYAIIEGEW